MGVKQAVREQYQATVDVGYVDNFRVPAEGWIKTVRKALGMSGAQLARRMGLTRARIAQAERAELDGVATLNSMKALAKALGCEFVYGFAPPGGNGIENVIIDQARKKAAEIVGRSSRQMALEDQSLSTERTEAEINRLTLELLHDMPPGFWEPE